jgi:hypothetical protein
MKDTVKSIAPANRSYETHGNTIEIFYIEFVSGLKGEFKQQQGSVKFEVGKEYDITVTETKRTSSEKMYNLIDKEKPAFSGAKTDRKPYESYYDKPEVQANITMCTSIELSIEFAKRKVLAKGDMAKLENVILNWILKDGELPKTQMNRRNALGLAIKTMDVASEEIDTTAKVFELAEKHLKKMI